MFYDNHDFFSQTVCLVIQTDWPSRGSLQNIVEKCRRQILYCLVIPNGCHSMINETKTLAESLLESKQ